MSSKFGPRAAGSDGSDFKHRQRVANHYKESVVNKFRLKCVLILHIFLIVLLFFRVSEDILDQFDLDWAPLERLNLPTPHFWEYWWLLSFAPIMLAFWSMPKNNSRLMTQSYYCFFALALLPIACGAGYLLPSLYKFIYEPSSQKFDLFIKFPIIILEYAFFAVSFQVHIFTMYFASQLIKAWRPVTVIQKDTGKINAMTEAEALVNKKFD
uniref:Protein jagunal n=1 Tax=Romanomermis culicivorax TaxID=13658 RepID=A0A915JAM7_ROMCU